MSYAIGYDRLREAARALMGQRAKAAVGAVLGSRAVGRVVGTLFHDRVPHGGCIIDTSAPDVMPETKARIFTRLYENPELRCVERYLRRDLDVVELGSSLGVLSCHISRRLLPQVRLICIEAHPALGAVIDRNLRANTPDRDFRVLHRAIHYGGEPAVRLQFGDETMRGKIANKSAPATVESSLVPASTLSEVLDEVGLHKDYALVADIEGAEVWIIVEDAPALQRCRQLVIELHKTEYKGRDYTIDDLAHELQERYGFRVRARDGDVWVFDRD